MLDRYEPASFESKWQRQWAEAELFVTREEEGRPKFYGLDFFPYPSGAGLSVGHCRNYIPTDVLCRMKVMQGYNVLHPMGFDAFGLPAENEAISKKTHPAPMIQRYAATYRRQMDLIGISYDWSRSFASSDPAYYRWTQWIFKVLYERGLAYRKMAAVNWDPVEQTVLADEEVVAGRGWRSGALVEKRYIPQWFMRITAYAQRLIDDLDEIDWPEGIKQMQRNWIGRSEGVEFSMRLVVPGQPEAGGEEDVTWVRDKQPFLRVFTTRIDTIFGMTFCVVAPEHPLVETLMSWADDATRESVERYVAESKVLSDTDRLATTREKTGVFTGGYAINPANGEKVPIWVADYVLMTYGTGAIMAVPGHDERDFEFAQKFGLPIRRVISPSPFDDPTVTDDQLPFEAKDGFLVNSGEYSGRSVSDSQTALGEWIEGLGIGERKVQYRLRDWLISRQRYWGCPIPIVHNASGAEEVVPDDQLPVLLPEVEHYEPSGDGTSPLAAIPEFVNTTDSEGRLGKRETDTMGGFACSSWYFLRFADPFNQHRAWDPEKVGYWLPVDCYVGGAEHAVMHLLYARFWTKVLYDAGHVPFKEPFARLMNQGMLLAQTPFRRPREGERLSVGEEGIMITAEEAAQLPPNEVFWRWEKMSKSKGNVVTPDEAVERYGADALRVFELFVAPFEQTVQWSEEGMQGAVRFLSRVFKLAAQSIAHFDADWQDRIGLAEMSPAARELRRRTHQAIAKSTADIERFAFNTYIAALMTFLNHITDATRAFGDEPNDGERLALSEALETLILLLSPAAPHTADELYEAIGREDFTYRVEWPVADEALAAEDNIVVAIQVNGKLRDSLSLPVGASDATLREAALGSPKVQGHLDGKEIVKVIVVPGKLVNVVVKG